jgi:hypothetical protein
MAKFIVTGDQHFDITGQMLEIQRQIRQRGGSPIDPKLVTQSLQNIIEGKMKKDNKILKLISSSESLVIPKCSGKRTFTNTVGIFKPIDWGEIAETELVDVSDETETTSVDIFESVGSETTYSQAFSALSLDFEHMCFSQDQILTFYENCKAGKMFKAKQMDLFLVKSKNRMYIFQLCEGYDGFYPWVKRFSFEQLPKNYTVRLIVPKKL